MQYIEVAGLRLSRIGLGTWQFGSREWGYGSAYARKVAPALLRRAVQLGITHVDTAEAYGPRHSERIVGDTLAGMDGAAAAVMVATKFMPLAPLEPILVRQAAGSRRRLRVDTLDLYYAHWPNPFVSERRVMQSVRPLVRDGVVRHVGVSNYSMDQWAEAERALGAPVVANQVPFSLVAPGPVEHLVPYAAFHERIVVAYSPLGQGLLAGRDAPGRRDVRALSPHFRPAALARHAPLRAALVEIAAAHGATPAQIALAWVISHPNTVAIPGARTVEQLEENAAAADIVLDAEEIARLLSLATASASA